MRNVNTILIYSAMSVFFFLSGSMVHGNDSLSTVLLVFGGMFLGQAIGTFAFEIVRLIKKR